MKYIEIHEIYGNPLNLWKFIKFGKPNRYIKACAISFKLKVPNKLSRLILIAIHQTQFISK